MIFYDSNDEKNIIYKMVAPFMFDANNIVSNDIEVKLKEVENCYEFTIIPDSKWLNNTETKYPVIIDPPLETSLEQNKIYDSYVDSYKPNRTAGDVYIFGVGHARWPGNVFGFQRAYIKFDLPTLTNAYKIEGAYLEAVLQEKNYDTNLIETYKVDNMWDEASLCWNNMPGYSDLQSSTYVAGNGFDRFTWNITNVVKQWYLGTAKNNGIMLRANNENVGYNSFYSKNTTADGPKSELVRPMVRIHYSYKENIKQYLGRAEAESFITKTGNVYAKLFDGPISGGHYVENIQNEGDSFTLNVNSRRSGIYEAQFMFMAVTTGQIAEVIVNKGENDQDKKNIDIPYNNGDWKYGKVKLKLRKGLNKVTVKAYKGVGWKLDYIDFVHKLPDTIEGENFDKFSGVLAVDDDNKLERRIGYQHVGDWYDYKVDVEKAGLYRFVFNFASSSDGGAFILKERNRDR